MSTTAVVALPMTGDSDKWTPTEAALVEAAGLTTGPPNNKRFAPRPVVEAFLLHARRTGLDPIARQIYCIERGGKWGTQVSIDGARLVAERTGQYRGQTPTQWTADGVTWVDVWLSKDNPAAARVGVYREGFEAPLVTVATWDAYNAGSPIWKKMPALMLGKCAEMLALRKAFPQDLSGLYSTEEMDQAGAPREVVRNVERPEIIAVPFDRPQNEQQRQANRAATVAGMGGDADMVAESASREYGSQSHIATPVATRDWVAEAKLIDNMADLTALANAASAVGEIGLVIEALKKRKAELEQPTIVDVPAQSAVRRAWVRDARLMTTRKEVQELAQEAIAAGALAQVIEELEAIANTLVDPVDVTPTSAPSWPVADIPESTSEWVEDESGGFVESDAPGVLDDSIGGAQ